ncbi:hypothetical protein HYT33_01250 [Candidatus Roizmanbacteria bacterium]|nr:hypothetical protein [Candidatus Roizmanbacteria bacterium]
MQPKKGPFILLFSLLLVLIFIVGVRYGQRVEQTNKTVSYLLSLTPSAPTPTEGPLRFQTYEHKPCGLQFIYPSTISKKNEASDEAAFEQKKHTLLAFSCQKNPKLLSFFEGEKVATEEIKFQKRTLRVKTRSEEGQKLILLTLQNPLNGKTVYLMVDEKLYPLFESSLIFLK